MMKNKDASREAGPLAELSLHRLGAYAIEEELIEGIEIRPDHVTIMQGENRFMLHPKQASTFLIGMLRGRSWFFEQEDPFETQASPATAADKKATRPADRSLATTLDSLLEFSKEAGILEGFEKDEQNQSVRVDISACSTTLSYTDALGYLLDCIQHELRSLRGEH